MLIDGTTSGVSKGILIENVGLFINGLAIGVLDDNSLETDKAKHK
jgi:hypothetical protein